MILSTVLTTGQIIFILRIAIQILTSGGLFFIGLVVLGNAPRIASVATHDVLSRIAGGETSNLAALKWLFKRGKTNDPTSTSRLAVGVVLLISYSLFSKLTDVGLIGLHTCTTRGPDTQDFPASVQDDAGAVELLKVNMVNGTDPAAVGYFRCGASDPFSIKDALTGKNTTMYACTAWTNSTYADKTVFQNLNISDTAVLMPRQLIRENYPNSNVLELNGFYTGPLYRLVLQPTIMNGLAAIPHETGLRVFLGAPNPTPFTRYTIPQTLSLEVDVGCMTVGWYSQQAVYSVGEALQAFSTDPNGTWREYAGPDYLRNVVSLAVDEVRDYFKPLWNMSTLGTDPSQPDLVLGNNQTFTTVSSAAHVKSATLPDLPNKTDFDFSFDSEKFILGNCTERLSTQLNVTPPDPSSSDADSCNFLEIGGSQIKGGVLYSGVSRMVCATASQVNLVRVDIEIDGLGNIDATFDRLPSDLHFTRGDWWYTEPDKGDIAFVSWDPTDRYALTPNPTGSANHFIPPRSGSDKNFANNQGPGSGANAFTSIGSMILGAKFDTVSGDQFSALAYLEEENKAINFTPSGVTRWAGQLGASYILGSSSFNGWAANSIQGGPITVISTGGMAVVCYNPLYAIAFLPLVLAAICILIMSLGLLFTSSLLGAPSMKGFYAGLQPYASVILPHSPQSQTLLKWEYDGQPRLEPVKDGLAIEISGGGTAAGYLHREKTIETSKDNKLDVF